MARAWWILLVVALVFVTALVVVSRFRTTTTPIVLRFDGVVGTDPGDPGLYSYLTDGFETVDAFGGGRHDYPTVTPMVITQGGCGPVVRWQPLEERWTEWEHCGPGLGVTATTEYHEWFGIPDTEIETCPVPRPIDEPVASVTCVAAEATETYVVEVVGTEEVVVGGTPVETIHVRRSSVVEGGSIGTTIVDEWRVPGTPLLVRLQVESSNVTGTAIGDVTYRERVTLVLESLRPTG